VRWRHYIVAAATVLLILAALRLASIDRARVAAPLLLLNVVVIARFMGTGPAMFSAIAGAAGYSYDFLPPVGFAIEDPDDWVAFFTFLGTAVIAGELASRAERRAAEAQAGRKEIERLYGELEAAFDRASEAEAARRNERLKAALLDALTHNLRTPLTAIKASVTALIGAGPRPTELTIESQHELLEIIDEESDRLNRFIEGLSAPDEAPLSQPVHLRAVRLDEMVRAALVRAETLTRDHSIVVDIPDDLPQASVDPASIVEVLYMLLDNGSKYAPEGTVITVRAGRVDGRYLRLSVSDEGPGIEPALRERVFERFYRVPARKSHDRRRGGIGLGLSIARRLVEAQAGRLWIDDSPVGGTTVAMTLPVALDGVEASRRPAAAGVTALAGTGSGMTYG
jgi:two-component system sensor histidine kinase KdpD